MIHGDEYIVLWCRLSGLTQDDCRAETVNDLLTDIALSQSDVWFQPTCGGKVFNHSSPTVGQMSSVISHLFVIPGHLGISDLLLLHDSS